MWLPWRHCWNESRAADEPASEGLPGFPNFTPKAKRVIYLFQSGGPAQMDLFDHKPALKDLQGSELPDSIRQGQRLTGMTSRQASFPVAASKFRFAKHGASGQELSELLPHTAGIADDICIVRSLNTKAVNHDPAITFFQTGFTTRRPAVDRLLARIRPGQRQSRSARVRNDGFRRQGTAAV